MTEQKVVAFGGATDPSVSKEGRVVFPSDLLIEFDGFKYPEWFKEALLEQQHENEIEMNQVEQTLELEMENASQEPTVKKDNIRELQNSQDAVRSM